MNPPAPAIEPLVTPPFAGHLPVPVGLKWAYTLFMLVLVPVYWANYVFGMNDAAPQQWLSPGLYLAVWMAGLVVTFHIPTHIALKRFAGRASAA